MTATQQHEQIDPGILRQALAGMATPVVVVTTTVDGKRHGFTANSFTSVSMDPPLLGVYIAETASAFDAFMRTEHVAFNVLAADQAHVARQFATSGIDKFAGLEVDPTLTDAPVLKDTTVAITGPVADRMVVGDHVLLLVTPARSTPVRPSPLIYHQRAFHQLPTPEENG
ncbi:flavin reductase family protein [Nocardioides daeguensis]|uniref:Flavin reductase like domain-containing protein n=1 Tax=Nocardioides daeguensis TaxID=908359 RepID=A0ABP6W9Z0_9ACTN|nr:flavin reductase family protein [Nocardioides daeguensis]MBV6729357.1 flavin reductase family protein [Nocardioides daeguensis]MCR1774333.1 flavin reductase family protein [Nocardioides daeguensis]